MFENVQAAPADPILGLTQAYLADPRPEKINLGVGVYKDEAGGTPVLGSVRQAQQHVLAGETTKSYLPIDGPPKLGALTRALLFGDAHELVEGGRAHTAATPGGTGALRVAADLLQSAFPAATVWLSDPTWANHTGIFQAAGCETRTYAYLDREHNNLAFDRMTASLAQAKPGDAVVLHGCCHNPTGVDPSPAQWAELAALVAERKLLPVVDLAYQGFAEGLEEDAAGLRTLAEASPELLVCSSFSKNFGVYRDRVGALTSVAPSPDAATAVASRVKQCIRRNYSNPAAFGPLTVEAVLSDAALRAQWESELADMRRRIAGMRTDFARALDQRGAKLGPDGNAFVADQRGMFTLTGLPKTAVEVLRERHAVYVVGSGRVNVAGLTPDNLPRVCDAVAAVLAH
ncbi:MAG: amino acid aminotransferase [Planctomycetota bacterium]